MSPAVKACLDSSAPRPTLKDAASLKRFHREQSQHSRRGRNYSGNDDFGGDSERSGRVSGRVSGTPNVKRPVFENEG